MILRSGKSVMKRANVDEDLISKLHDALLIQILSFLPESDANRTRILSKRWRNVWMLLPNLHFVMNNSWSTEEVNKFHDSVDQTLAFRGGMPIQRFSLCCSKNCNSNRLYNWFCEVVQCKVHELEFRFPFGRYTVRFCWDLLKTCTSLISLTLGGGVLFHVPDAELLFPCLKKIVLQDIEYQDHKSIMKLISGSPCLEEFFMEKYCVGRFDQMEIFMVSSPSLKRLSLSSVLGRYMLVIHAPKLEYLYIWDSWPSFTITKPPSLTEAHIEANSHGESLAQLLTCISSVKILTLDSSTVMALRDGEALRNDEGLNLHVFPNLVKLVVWIYVTWNTLPMLLYNMPNLEHITFADGFVPFPSIYYEFSTSFDPGEGVPGCLQFKMKDIIIENREAIVPEEFDLIRYLLKHSKSLETLTMNAHNISRRRRKKILNFHRGSKSSRIQFV